MVTVTEGTPTLPEDYRPRRQVILEYLHDFPDADCNEVIGYLEAIGYEIGSRQAVMVQVSQERARLGIRRVQVKERRRG